MCENCFLNETEFKDRKHWENFDLELSKKLGAEKLVPLYFKNDGVHDKDDGLYIYKCTSCNEKWKLRDPVDYNGRGWFLRYSTKEPINKKGCFAIFLSIVAIIWIMSFN
jgi:hypothetical protein